MKTKLLLPFKCKMIGFFLSIPAFILMLFNLHSGFTFEFLDYKSKSFNEGVFDDKGFLTQITSNNFTDEIGSLILIIGLLMIAFSKERYEDERTQKLRLDSLLGAILVNYFFIIFSIIFFYNGLFMNILAYNICTPLILFIVRFNYLMYKEQKKLKPEIL